MSKQTVLRQRLRTTASGALLALACMSPAWAQDATEQADEGEPLVTLYLGSAITPQAQAVLDRMKATFNAMKRYSVTAKITRDEMLPYGYKLQNNESARMWVDAPNHLRVEVLGDIKDRTYVYDGSQLTVFAPDHNVYSTTTAPGTLRELVGALLDAGIEMPLIDFLYQGATGNLTESVRVGMVVGDSEVDGVPTDHLAFRQPDVDWQLWVEKGEQALPRKLLITTRYAVGDPQYQAVLQWNLKPDMPARAFEFAPPTGATRIQNRSKLVADGAGE